MKKRLQIFSLYILLALLLAGCQENSSTTDDNDTGSTKENVSAPIAEADMFTNRDLDGSYDKNTAIYISLNGSSISCESDAVKISNTTITLSQEATYIFSGTLENGMIVVNAGENDKLQIVFDNASITSKTSAPLYILEGDKVFVTLADGTSNALANGGTFSAIDDNNIDGAIFSKQDLTFNGSGSLTVTSPSGHGIVCKDDLVFTNGTYIINSASHGLDANDSVRTTVAKLTITSGKDGIHAENSDDTSLGFFYMKDGALDITAEGDGLSAGNTLQINDGSISLLAGGGSENGTKQSSDSWGGFMGGGGRGGRGEHTHPGGPLNQQTTEADENSTSMKGIKATGNLAINGGTFTIDSADDSIHSNASVTINDGTFSISSGDDAFHADDTLRILAGNIDIAESYEGLEGLHVIVSGGDIKLVASDDGLNAAGGTDSSGTTGGRDAMFGGGGRGGMGGPGGASSSNGSIVISGGTLYVKASGDGLDANGTLEITGGYTIVCGPTQGDTATLDYDKSAVISGGTFIGTGASGMAQTFSDSEQGVIAVSVGNQTSGIKIELKDSNGKTLITHEPGLSFAIVIVSSPEIEKGETYTINVGSSTGEFEAN